MTERLCRRFSRLRFFLKHMTILHIAGKRRTAYAEKTRKNREVLTMRKRIMAFIMSAVVAVSPVMAFAEETELQDVMEEFTDESAVSPAENGQEQEPAVMQESQDIPGDAEIPAPAEDIPAEETVEPSDEDTEQVEDFIIMEEEMPVEESANASAFPDEGIIFEETMEASSDSENSGYEDNGMSGEIRMPLIFPTEDTIRKMQNPEFKPEAKSAKQKTFKVTENDTDSVKREKALQAMGTMKAKPLRNPSRMHACVPHRTITTMKPHLRA